MTAVTAPANAANAAAAPAAAIGDDDDNNVPTTVSPTQRLVSLPTSSRQAATLLVPTGQPSAGISIHALSTASHEGGEEKGGGGDEKRGGDEEEEEEEGVAELNGGGEHECKMNTLAASAAPPVAVDKASNITRASSAAARTTTAARVGTQDAVRYPPPSAWKMAAVAAAGVELKTRQPQPPPTHHHQPPTHHQAPPASLSSSSASSSSSSSSSSSATTTLPPTLIAPTAVYVFDKNETEKLVLQKIKEFDHEAQEAKMAKEINPNNPAKRAPSDYCYSRILPDLDKLNFSTPWDNHKGQRVYVTSWANKPVAEGGVMLAQNNRCNTKANADTMKLNRDYFLEARMMVDYLRKHGFVQVDAESSSTSSSSSATTTESAQPRRATATTTLPPTLIAPTAVYVFDKNETEKLVLQKIKEFDHEAAKRAPTANCYSRILPDLAKLNFVTPWDNHTSQIVYVTSWANKSVADGGVMLAENDRCNSSINADTMKLNRDYFVEACKLVDYLRKHGFVQVDAASSSTSTSSSSSSSAAAAAATSASSARPVGADLLPGESNSISTSSDPASDDSLAGEALVMSHVNSYYNAVNAGKPAPFYLYPAIESDLGKLGWMRVWDRKQCGHVVLAPWSGVDVEEKPNPRNNSCDVVQSGRKNNVDYFWDTKDLTLYLQKHGFNRVETQEAARSRSSLQEAARPRSVLSSLLKPDVVADATNAVAASQQPPLRSRPPTRSVHATKMSVSSRKSGTSSEEEEVEVEVNEQLSPTAKVMQLIREYDDYESANKRLPGDLIHPLSPSTIIPSNNYPSVYILQAIASCQRSCLICCNLKSDGARLLMLWVRKIPCSLLPGRRKILRKEAFCGKAPLIAATQASMWTR